MTNTDKVISEKSEEVGVIPKIPSASSDTNSLIDQAKQAAALMKAENDRKEALIKREEEIQARNLLSGKAEAGQTPQPKEETPKEYKDRIMRGGV